MRVSVRTPPSPRRVDTWRGWAGRIEPQVRRRARRHWAGVAVAVDPDAGDTGLTDECNRAFGALFEALAARGNPPDGPFWLLMREAGDGGLELVLRWPVAASADGLEVDGHRVVTGTLGEGDELVVDVPVDAPGASATAPMAPEVIAFFEAADERGAGGREVRQIAVPGPDGVPVEMELAVSL